MTEFVALVKEMRIAQKEYFKARRRYHEACNSLKRIGIREQAELGQKASEALQRSKALESRVDQEIRAAEEAEGVQNGDVIVMKDGRKLVQGNLFENL